MENPPISKNVDRMLDLLWRNYQEQVTINRRISDRAAVILGGVVALVGLLARTPGSSGLQFVAGIVAAVSLIGAFWFACTLWKPYQSEQPGTTDIDRLWADTVGIAEEHAAANLLSDICRSIRVVRQSTDRIADRFRWFTGCCSLAVLAMAISAIFGG